MLAKMVKLYLAIRAWKLETQDCREAEKYASLPKSSGLLASFSCRVDLDCFCLLFLVATDTIKELEVDERINILKHS